MQTFLKACSLVAQPTGVWEKIIMAFNGGISNYAAAVIVLTLCIKLIMLPLDFFNKLQTRKNSKIQAEMAPEMEQLKKKFGSNKQVLNAKTAELYKKHNFKVGRMFLFMIANLGLTLFVFITLFNGLNSMSRFKAAQQYEDLQYAYISQLYQGEHNLEEEQLYAYVNQIKENPTQKEAAQKAVVQKYAQIKDSFLWIDNVWVADSPLAKNIMDWGGYLSWAGIDAKKVDDADKAVYETVMSSLEGQKRENGYLVLPVLALGLVVLQQLISSKKIRFKKKPKNIEDETPKQKTNWIMIVILAALYGYMTMCYNSVFSLYLVVSSLFSTLSSPFINYLADLIEKKRKEKIEKKNTVSYSRKKL